MKQTTNKSHDLIKIQELKHLTTVLLRTITSSETKSNFDLTQWLGEKLNE